MNCDKCGYDNRSDWEFCGNCGSSLKAECKSSFPDKAAIDCKGKTEPLLDLPAPSHIEPVAPLPLIEQNAIINPMPELVLKTKRKKLNLPAIITIVLVLIIGSATAAAFGVNAMDTKKYDELIDTGNKYLEELKYEEAVETFIAAIDIKPKREEAYVGAARGYVGLDEPEKAKDILKKGLENIEDPNDDFKSFCDELGVEYNENGETNVTSATGTTPAVSTSSEQDKTDVMSTKQDVSDVSTTKKQEKTDVPTTKTTTSPATTTTTTSTTATIKVGDIVYFGKYEQDNNSANGKEKIAWRVLAVENGKAFLLADKILDSKPYNDSIKDVTWEYCSLRLWLNKDFYKSAFSASEQASINAITVLNSEDDLEYGIDGGNDTNDKIFLLNYTQADKYFVNASSRTAQGTDFAKANGLYFLNNAGSDSYGNSLWWLRSPGSSPSNAGIINLYGHIGNIGNSVSSTEIGVRPVLWKNI